MFAKANVCSTLGFDLQWWSVLIVASLFFPWYCFVLGHILCDVGCLCWNLLFFFTFLYYPVPLCSVSTVCRVVYVCVYVYVYVYFLCLYAYVCLRLCLCLCIYRCVYSHVCCMLYITYEMNFVFRLFCSRYTLQDEAQFDRVGGFEGWRYIPAGRRDDKYERDQNGNEQRWI